MVILYVKNTGTSQKNHIRDSNHTIFFHVTHSPTNWIHVFQRENVNWDLWHSPISRWEVFAESTIGESRTMLGCPWK